MMLRMQLAALAWAFAVTMSSSLGSPVASRVAEASVTTAPGTHNTKQITFFVASDTHFGHIDVQGQDARLKNMWTIDAMHSTPGMEWPELLGAGKVEEPVGVVITGDLIDRGGNQATCEGLWGDFVGAYGLNGTDGKLRYPVYEGFGNHDGGHSTAPPEGECNVVRHSIAQRTQRRQGLAAVSANGLHYSWDWGPLHLVMLNLAPAEQQEAEPEGTQGATWNDPEHALGFLVQDLAQAVGSSGRPVLVFHHYGFDHMSSWSYWSDYQRALYLDVLHSYNVAALVHGHTHICVLYKFKGLDVLNAPAAQRENATSSLPPSFLVVQLDMGSGMMRVAERVGEGWGQKVMTKQVVVPKQ